METKIIINNEPVPVSWEKEIGKGAIVYVHAPSLIYATVAVEFFLRQLGYYHLWYGSDVICKAGVFQFEIVEVKEADGHNLN
jgi:hypothetical protein